MSIINKMHKGLKESVIDSPVLMSIPEKKTKYKALLFTLIGLLFVSSIALSVLIYNQRTDVENITALVSATDSSVTNTLAVTQDNEITPAVPTSSMAVETTPIIKETATNEEVLTNQQLVINDEVVAEKGSNITTEAPVKEESVVEDKEVVSAGTLSKKKQKTIEDDVLNSKKVVTKKQAVVDEKVTAKVAPIPVKEKVVSPTKPIKTKVVEEKKSSHLEIKKSTLTDFELAKTHLKKAEQALEEGDNFLASKEKRQALNIKPDLHDVRKTLALYYYSIGEQGQAVELLKKGALAFPEYSDFNLMLSRIALKNDNQQKAYLYLNQNPPVVEGHLDYHASYAILAQKFNKYEQAEQLYQGILKYRPDNGRWLMSLAIMQDKQKKKSLAISNYQKALEQIDLSSKAKQYINQRLIYLENQ